MLYYKFRPPNELYYKEFLYNELFFSNNIECNDPYDSSTFFVFNQNLRRWKNLLEFVVSDIQDENLKKNVINLSTDFCNASPMTFEELETHELLEAFPHASIKGRTENLVTLKEFFLMNINAYRPPTNYFVSFSKINNEPLMWSHYADSHKGYCMIYKDINGMIRQHPEYKKSSITMRTPFGILSPQTSFGIPAEFEIKDIEYTYEIDEMDAFECFPEQIWNHSGKKINPNEYNVKRNRYLLQKAESWSYEKESRISFKQVTPWISRIRYDFSSQERLFRYDPYQLVGIIFGARTTEETKRRLNDIITEHMKKLSIGYKGKRLLFDFVTFESLLTNDRREMKIEPIKVNTLTKSINKDHIDFNKIYRKWKEGWGLEFENSTVRKIKVKN